MGPNMEMAALVIMQERERAVRNMMRVREAGGRTDTSLKDLDGNHVRAKTLVAAIVAVVLAVSGAVFA